MQKDLFGNKPLQTTCAYCDKPVAQTEAVVSTVAIGSTVVYQEHFCSMQHAEMFWAMRELFGDGRARV